MYLPTSLMLLIACCISAEKVEYNRNDSDTDMPESHLETDPQYIAAQTETG